MSSDDETTAFAGDGGAGGSGAGSDDNDNDIERRAPRKKKVSTGALPTEREGERFDRGGGSDSDDSDDAGSGEDQVDDNGNKVPARQRSARNIHSLYRTKHPAKLGRRSPREPAARLSIDSMSAYAPFQGMPMGWMSQVYDDAATYEGTEYVNMPHGKGVFHAGVQGGGLGINELMPGDRYEGELYLGFASGLGMLSRQDGRVYRGEFLLGRKHGCGAETDLSPFYEELEKGTDPEEAWERTKAKVAAATRRGTFRGDEFDSGPVEDSDDDDGGHRKSRRKNKKKNKGKVTALDDFDGDDADLRPSDREHRFCTLAEVEGTVEEVEHIVARAKMFEHKPDGAVSTSFTHDDNGTPAPLMQDPLHYPFGTKWMAPGPLGQCFRLPDDEQVLENLDAAAHNHELIWREFNLPRVIEPGTDMAEAVRHSQKVASVRLRDVEPAEMRRAAVELVREVREKAEAVAAAEREAEEDAAGGKPGGSRRPRRRERISDDDLVADAAGLSVSVSGSGSGKGNGGNGGNGGSVFASASASLFGGNNDPAALFASALGRAAEAVASRVPPLGGRRGLARPSRRE